MLGLVVQALFSVTLVTLSAAAALLVLNLAYTGSTGLYFFVDSNIPIAVFLGLHLLITDPATSPKRSAGKVIFGAMYGALVFGLYALLGRLGEPTFYDKLLCVPALNLLVRPLDQMGAALEARFRRWTWTPRQANFAHMGAWTALFAVMLTTGFVGGRHPGSDSEFWRKACESGSRGACQTWVRVLNVACRHGSGLACLRLGVMWNEGRGVERDPNEAGKNFARACDLGMPYGCPSLVALVKERGPEVFRPACGRGDGESCFILASLYYAGGGVPKDPAAAVGLFRKSCSDGWWRGCGGLAECYPRREGGCGRCGGGLGVFRGGVPPRRGGQLLRGRHHVPRDEGRGARAGKVPAGVRSEPPLRDRERGILPARRQCAEGGGTGVLFASGAVRPGLALDAFGVYGGD